MEFSPTVNILHENKTEMKLTKKLNITPKNIIFFDVKDNQNKLN